MSFNLTEQYLKTLERHSSNISHFAISCLMSSSLLHVLSLLHPSQHPAVLHHPMYYSIHIRTCETDSLSCTRLHFTRDNVITNQTCPHLIQNSRKSRVLGQPLLKTIHCIRDAPKSKHSGQETTPLFFYYRPLIEQTQPLLQSGRHVEFPQSHAYQAAHKLCEPRDTD